MKIVKDNIVLNQPGTVKIIPEEPDDLWLLYNLIAAGDVISTVTSRKVHGDGGRKAKATTRVRITLDISIATVDYDKASSTVRAKGKSLTSNEYVASGSFHTIEIETNKEFDLRKKVWDSAAIDALREGSQKASSADLAVVLIEEDFAAVFLIGGRSSKVCPRINAPKSKKSKSNKFFEDIFAVFVKYVNFDTVRCAVIASSGSAKDEFRRFLLTEAQKSKLKTLEKNKSRIVVATTKGKIQSLNEVLHDEAVMSLVGNTKAAMEIKAFKEFSDALSSNSDQACYGEKSVEMAQEMTAIETLLITDDLYSSGDIATRRKYMELVKAVKKGGGNAFVFSPEQGSGEELAKLTGVAAILRFPVPDIDYLVI
ncbi:hypothetical protein L484_022620 [Morus notabilis]|uniref:Protein pelota homolog n=2 Tax=Morus notabilis TaxID=981085 RepID=W9R8G3_9ROSA|nr:hypothetical protein L484_022620 [Morus notabilis]